MDKTTGKLIVVEGACDGIGKSTQYKLLCDHLKQDDILIINHHFPTYNTKSAVPIECYLKGDYGSPNTLSPYFINSLYAIDRYAVWKQKLEKEYLEGKYIVLDRYTTSSLIYQAALIEDEDEKKNFIDYVLDYEYKKLGLKQPDQVIFLAAPFDVVTELRKSRKSNDGISNDIHESDLAFMRKVYDNALFIADYLSWDKIECVKDDKFIPIDEIHDKVYRKIKRS